MKAVPNQLQQQLENLQVENAQLRQELNRFEAILRAFLGDSSQSTGAESAPATPLSAADAIPPPAPVPAKTLADSTSNCKSVKSNGQSTPLATSSPASAKPIPGNRPRRKGQALARAKHIFHALIA